MQLIEAPFFHLISLGLIKWQNSLLRVSKGLAKRQFNRLT